MLKTMKKYLCFMLSIIVVLSFTACNSEKEEVAEGNNATISTGTANEETQPGESEETTHEASVTPEPTEEPVAEPSDEWSEKIPWGDLDGDGTEEYILLESGDFLGENVVNGRITMYVNDEPVYQYAEELRITSVGDKAYLDLNGDGQEEIFVSFYPAVNSASLAEWFVLEKTGEGWQMLEMYHFEGDMLSNAFPITVLMDKNDFGLSIRCEGWDGEIPFDATTHYERMKIVEAGINAYELFTEGQYKVGDVVGGTLPYGIWEIRSGTYQGENCLIALHGLGGPAGMYDIYGNADVYFNYDENGKIKILDMEFEPAITEADKYDWIGQMGEVGKYFSSVYPTGKEVVISEFTADLTHDGCDDLIQVVGYSVEESADVETVTSTGSEGCYVKVFKGRADGNYEEKPVFISRNYHMSHMGNGTICMSEVNGEKYLLTADISEGQGEAAYWFAAYYVDSENWIRVEEQSEVIFSVDKESHPDWDERAHREDVMDEFRAKISPYLEKSVLLLSLDINEDAALYSTTDEVLDANTYFEKVWEREN